MFTIFLSLMLYEIQKEHIRFYQQHHWLELLSPLTSAKRNLLVELHPKKEKECTSLKECCDSYRDAFRTNPEIKKILEKSLKDILFRLQPVSELYIGGTLLVKTPKQPLPKLWSGLELSPEELFSLNPLVATMVIHLKGPELTFPFPKEPGNILFLEGGGGGVPLDFLKDYPDTSLLFVALCDRDAVYDPSPQSPNPFFLRDLGYSLKQALQSSLHPLIRR